MVLTAGVSLVLTLQASQLDAGRAAMQQREYSHAVELFGECVLASKTPEDRVPALTSYGIALHRVGRNYDAKNALEQALAESANVPEQRANRVTASDELASVKRNLGDYAGAESTLRTALQDQATTSNEKAALATGLIDLLREQGRTSEAQEVLGAADALTGLTWQRRIELLAQRAEQNRDLHLWEASIAAWNQIADLAASQHSTVYDGMIAGGLGETWFAAGNPARAEPLLRRSIQLLRNDPTSSAQQLATGLAALATLYTAENKLAMAEETLNEAIAKDEDSLGPSHPQIGALLELRATILSRRGETQEARDELERARTIMTSHFGADSMAVAGVFASMGEVEQRANQPAAAVTEYALAMRLFRQAGTDSSKYASAIVARYAAALRAAHRPDEARALLQSFQPIGSQGGQSFRAK
jgi:tetratricopeptide (TPR) repeat protein